MGLFRRDPPPPPPPPPSKWPMWTQIAVPIVFAVIMSLSALSFDTYKTYAENKMDGNKAAIEKLQDRKVDNETMQLMIELQKQQLQSTIDQLNTIKKDTDRIQVDMQKDRDKLNQMLIDIQKELQKNREGHK